MPNTRRKGNRGEDVAVAALQRAGYTILARNWRVVVNGKQLGELDIIARHKGDMVAVEVKSRRDGIDMALESITPAKARKLTQMIEAYLAMHNLSESAYRIDVAAVCGETVEIIEHAVGW
jgi:putative endonuclease